MSNNSFVFEYKSFLEFLKDYAVWLIWFTSRKHCIVEVWVEHFAFGLDFCNPQFFKGSKNLIENQIKTFECIFICYTAFGLFETIYCWKQFCNCMTNTVIKTLSNYFGISLFVIFKFRFDTLC